MFGDHLEQEEREEALQILSRYTEGFKLPGVSTGQMNQVTHTIDVSQAAPILQRLRNVPIPRRALVEVELAQMLSEGMIELAKGPMASPVMLGQ